MQTLTKLWLFAFQSHLNKDVRVGACVLFMNAPSLLRTTAPLAAASSHVLVTLHRLCPCTPALALPANISPHTVAMSMLAGPKYVTRTLTNVKPTSATYTAVIEAPEGFIVTLSPQSFTAAAGASTTVRIRIQKSSRNTPYSVWQAGAITWVGSGGTRTRIPLVVRAVQLASRPTEVKLKAWQGSYSYLVEPEWNGVLATANTGLQPSEVYSGTVEVSEYSHRLQVVLPPGVWSYVRFATFNDDVSGACVVLLF